MSNEIALTVSWRLHCRVGATVMKSSSGASGPLSLHASVLESGSWVLVCSVFVLVRLRMCFHSEGSVVNAV